MTQRPNDKVAGDPILRIEELKVYFDTDQGMAKAVDGVSFQVHRGETVCLVGESGCGKTVSALSILGLLPQPPAQIAGGRVVFKDRDLLALGQDDLQRIRGREISMVFQEPMTSLNPVFTIGHQIEEVIITHEEVGDSQAQERIIKLLSDVGIPSPEERIHDYPHNLSGGMRQRVMIAMALACNPDLIIADEPTTALDVTIQAQILNLFSELQDKRRMAILQITHDLSVVAGIADRIYVMYAGITVEEGSRWEIFRDPCHPYTMGLLESLPGRRGRGQELTTIPGRVPDPTNKPSGCPFNPRCRYVQKSCRTEFPDMCDFGDAHLARCPIIHARRREVRGER
ncbi:MAG: ABC transporter ATP-binding protein [Deltaproteobacteria bacterium]|nr:MAG: ABC transporter ATP-binding protein [Deltaproteobacteria bacterium]